MFPVRESAKVIIIEGDVQAAELMRDELEKSGVKVIIIGNSLDGLSCIELVKTDIVILSLDLPDINGFEMVKYISQNARCGIIVSTTNSAHTDGIAALELGADDLIIKPFSSRELLARIRAIKRRARIVIEKVTYSNAGQILDMGSFRINYATRAIVGSNDREVRLTSAQFSALETLISAKGEPVSRETLTKVALNKSRGPNDRGVDQLIFNMRQRFLDLDCKAPIKPVHNVGYVFDNTINNSIHRS